MLANWDFSVVEHPVKEAIAVPSTSRWSSGFIKLRNGSNLEPIQISALLPKNSASRKTIRTNVRWNSTAHPLRCDRFTSICAQKHPLRRRNESSHTRNQYD